MSSSDDSAAAHSAPDDGRNRLAAIHPDILKFHILNRLDGADLAAMSCASTEFLSLCDDDRMWRDICNSTWPSTACPHVRRAISAFPSHHRSFYSDAITSFGQEGIVPRCDESYPPECLISAVDVFYGDQVVCSKVMETGTRSDLFTSFPLILEVLNSDDSFPTPLNFEPDQGATMRALVKKHFKVSWLLIDPARKRAVNVASRKPMEIRWQWICGEIQLRYAIVMVAPTDGGNSVQFTVVVNCGGKEGGKLHVKEVKMFVEDMEGKILSGNDSLRIISAAMERRRRRSDCRREKAIHRDFLRTKAALRERRERKETVLDLICMGFGLSIFLAICMYFML